ncbi:MAG: acetate uptake transporter [Rubrobacter sp.]
MGGFALTTFVLSCVNAGLVSENLLMVFVPLAFFYGGLAQFLAGIWEFRNNNTFGATAFSSYGMFWVALAFFVFFEGQLGITEQTAATALGLTLLAWTIFTAIMWVGSFSTNTGLVAVFTLLLATFVLLTIGDLGGVELSVVLGGYVGIVTAFAAWYMMAAGVINNTAGRVILPVGERG